MTVNTEVKGTLAKLLATENLNVEHRKVSTAYFDVKARVLCLPIWKDVSGSVYDLLVGHEVGHALYTPVEYGEVSQEVPQDILNVLEDVRVEKLMKRRYPGLAKSFYNGYTELDAKDFFELEGKDLSKMSLIDRINVHYKCGVIGNRTIVPFEREEMQWVNRAADTETFEDIVSLSKELMEYLKRKKEEMQQNVNVELPQSAAGGGPGEQEGDEMQVGPTNSETNDGGSSTQQTTQDGSDITQDMGGSSSVGGRNISVDEFTSETYRAMSENQQNLVDKRAKDYIYVNIPQVKVDKMIVPFKQTTSDFFSFLSDQKNRHKDAVQNAIVDYRKYKKDSIKTVNYLVKEFECKKAADQYHRASTSNTGVLDTQKLHTFKWNEDLFKKVTTLPDGKNHGLVFYLDWSGSMSNIMLPTLKQLYDLLWFCKKVNIPFRVYAFSDSSSNSNLFPGKPCENKENYLYIDDDFRLIEFFSSKMNAQTLDKMMECMFYNCSQFRCGSGQYNYQYSLSGTPLVETIVTTPQVVEKFKTEEKVQKVNVVYLSDGEAAYPTYTKYNSYLGENHAQPMYGDHVYVIKDPKSRYQTQLDLQDNYITNAFVGIISNLVDYNLLGFRLGSKGEVHSQLRSSGVTDIYSLDKEWEKNKSVCIPNCGFNELYVMQTPKVNTYQYWNPKEETNLNTLEISENATKGALANAFAKHMTNKMINKTILSKFVGQIA